MSITNKLNYAKENIDKLKELTKETVLSLVVDNIKQNYGSGGGDFNEYLASDASNTTAMIRGIIPQLLKKIPNTMKELIRQAVEKSKSCYYLFADCINLEEVELVDICGTTELTNMSNMLYNCKNLKKIDFNGLNTSNVEDMSYLLYGCSSLTNVDLRPLNINNVTKFGSVCAYCTSLVEIDITGLDTSKVTSMLNPFTSCTNLIRVIGELDVSGMTQTSPNMLTGTTKLETFYIKNLNWTGLRLSFCPNLSHDSLMYLINNLVNMSNSANLTVTLGSVLLAKLTDEEKAIAINKNWTLA